MSNPTQLKLPKWPFFLGDAVLLALAYLIIAQRGRAPLDGWQTFLVVLGVAGGAALAVVPFVLEYRAAVRLLESSGLASTVAEIQNLEMIAAQINAATARWQVVQEHSNNSVAAAREITTKISAEAGAFREFLQKSHDTEKANLRLEVEKLRRTEHEWLQVVVRLLDHVYALHRAAERSGQRSLIDQLGLFQNSCRDVARRMGVAQVTPEMNDTFDPQFHHLPESHPQPAAEARIHDILATGITYQGRLIRPAMVILHEAGEENGDPVAANTPPSNETDKPQVEPSLL